MFIATKSGHQPQHATALLWAKYSSIWEIIEPGAKELHPPPNSFHRGQTSKTKKTKNHIHFIN